MKSLSKMFSFVIVYLNLKVGSYSALMARQVHGRSAPPEESAVICIRFGEHDRGDIMRTPKRGDRSNSRALAHRP